MAEGEIINKVKQSDKLVTLDLQQFYDDSEVAELDLKDFLFQGLLLKEKDFREDLQKHDWIRYKGKYLAVFCSTDAILAPWAFMLVACHAKPYAIDVCYGRSPAIKFDLYRKNMDRHDWSQYRDKFVLLKGCSDKPVTESVYLYATDQLIDAGVRKLMYGEACSNVPVFRRDQ